MSCEWVFVLGADGEGDAGVVIEYPFVLAGAWVVEIEGFEGCPLVVAEAEAPLALLVEREVAPAVVGTRRGYAFPVDEIYFVAVSEGGSTLFEALLDIVEGAFAAVWGEAYGDSREG